MLLGGRHGLRRTLPQDEFTFDAQELGDAPALLIALGSRERLADYREPSAALASTPNWNVRLHGTTTGRG
jgi:hypothetical protein